MEKPAFDLESVYDEKIAPLMDQIIAICKEHKLPMLSTFLYQNDGEDDSLCTTSLLFEERPIPKIIFEAADLIVNGRSIKPLRMSVKGADGKTVQETVILG